MTRRVAFIAAALVMLAAGLGIGALVTHEQKRTVTETSVETIIRPTTDYATTTIVRVRRIVHTRTRINTVVAQPPAPQGFDYGAYTGDFRASGITVHADSIGETHISGELAYIGGLGCDPSYVEISATFFDSSRDVVDTGLANFSGMAEGAWYPFDASSDASGISSASAVISQASC